MRTVVLPCCRDLVCLALFSRYHCRVNTKPSGTRFRSDIQGLRAIAVVAVLLYHARLPWFPGGYVGVDVFFVISGFLITSHLLGSMARYGRIPFADFYAKRVRRILPASFVVLAVSLVLAFFLYPPLLMRQVWLGGVATALYVPNVLFARQGIDYLAETTPSLFQHYWSLGIEEQFYLVWPLLLAVAFVVLRKPKWVGWFVAVLVVLSLLGSIWLTEFRQPYAFFLLPTRAWELGVGGLAAFLLRARPDVVRGRTAGILGWAGLVGITASILLFTAHTPFPGYMAAIPVLSTAAVVVAGGGVLLLPGSGPRASCLCRDFSLSA